MAVTGLLGRVAAFREVGFFHSASSLVAVCACRVVSAQQGFSLACLVGLLLFVKWFSFSIFCVKLHPFLGL